MTRLVTCSVCGENRQEHLGQWVECGCGPVLLIYKCDDCLKAGYEHESDRKEA